MSDIDAQDFLRMLADPLRSAIDARRVALVVAHPDDETVGCGALLSRLLGLTIVLVTDGAPRDLRDARRLGFARAEDYAAARRRELFAALALAGIPARSVVFVGLPDQGAAFRLAFLTRRLGEVFTESRICVALTHAYEGGHPDHDATAFAAHMACRSRHMVECAPEIVEMPFYRRGAMQRFLADPRYPEWIVPLTPNDVVRKRSMIAAHQTQTETLRPFALDCANERFRIAPPHDFSRPPHAGRLFYEDFDWGLDAAQWNRLTAGALREIGEGER